MDNLSAYVKVLLISEDQVQKRRRSGSQKWSETNSFVFNEEYIFPVPVSDGLNEVTVVFTVTCRDSQGHSVTLGKANTGPLSYAEGPGLLLWQEMQEFPAQWFAQSLSIA